VTGAAVYRDYDIYADGKYIGEATASWVTANYESRKLVVPRRLPEVSAAKTPDASQVKTIKLQKLRLPGEPEKLYDYRVRYSDTDVNGHMNNVKYADVVCDALEMETKPNEFASGIELDYVSECKAGEILELSTLKTEDGSFVTGCDGEGKEKFTCKIKFSHI
jgi:acyl-ACP thioesterase